MMMFWRLELDFWQPSVAAGRGGALRRHVEHPWVVGERSWLGGRDGEYKQRSTAACCIVVDVELFRCGGG